MIRSLILTNPYVVSEKDKEIVWSTGLDSVQEGEDATYRSNQVMLPKVDKFSTLLTLYNTNQTVLLRPGDTYVIETKCSKEILYYLALKDTPYFKIVNRDGYIKPTFTQVEGYEGYLFEADYSKTPVSYEYAYDYFNNQNPEIKFGTCSSVRAGDLYGRNYDWYYDNCASFVYTLDKNEDEGRKYKSINVGGGIPSLTKEVIESGVDSKSFRILPFMAVDGMNIKDDGSVGIVCNTNVNESGHYCTGTNEGKQRIPQIMLIRYLLDHCASVEEVIDEFENLDVYASQFGDGLIELHLLVADKDRTIIIEFTDKDGDAFNIIEPGYTAGYIDHSPAITNFMITDTLITEDPEGNRSIDPNLIYKYGQGVERYNIILSKYNQLSDLDSVKDLMIDLNYTNAYETPWLTEFAGDYTSTPYDVDLTVQGVFEDPTQYDELMTHIQDDIYAHRSRNAEGTMRTWHTVTTSIYDIENKKLYLDAQQSGVFKEYILE